MNVGGDSYAKGTLIRGHFVVEPWLGRGGTRPRTFEKGSPFVAEGIYRATLARLEHIRAQVNLRFLADMEQTEKRDAARYEQREYN
jgi:hypothetical protein